MSCCWCFVITLFQFQSFKLPGPNSCFLHQLKLAHFGWNLPGNHKDFLIWRERKLHVSLVFCRVLQRQQHILFTHIRGNVALTAAQISQSAQLFRDIKRPVENEEMLTRRRWWERLMLTVTQMLIRNKSWQWVKMSNLFVKWKNWHPASTFHSRAPLFLTTWSLRLFTIPKSSTLEMSWEKPVCTGTY